MTPCQISDAGLWLKCLDIPAIEQETLLKFLNTILKRLKCTLHGLKSLLEAGKIALVRMTRKKTLSILEGKINPIYSKNKIYLHAITFSNKMIDTNSSFLN